MPCREAMSVNNHTQLHIDDPLSLVELGSSGPVQVLLTRVSNAWKNANRDEAVRSCYAAVRSANQANDLTGIALAQLYLADTCARCERPAEGVDWARRAARRFGLLGDDHNAMVAHLLLAGLGCSLHNLDQAQLDYQQALEICQRLQSEEKGAARRKAALYGQLAEEIQRAITATATTAAEHDQAHLSPFPILRLSDGPDMAVSEHSDVIGYAATTGEFLIAGRTYYLYSLGETPENQVGLETDAVQFALPVPKDGWLDPASKQGDYVLVQQEAQITREGPGVSWTGEKWVGGRFERDAATGNIHFTTPQPHIIGRAQGCAIALLKPMA